MKVINETPWGTDADDRAVRRGKRPAGGPAEAAGVVAGSTILQLRGRSRERAALCEYAGRTEPVG
ncbi:MAG: hypothetical protein MK041_13800, partial [Aquabacterium sp.]|nr:hypothetical protein [Aquabacterium sp.]